ncbi:MAG: (Fe-S)-binding protein [bacterium]|nr:(Fe-S)-binding protein [bacterium]
MRPLILTLLILASLYAFASPVRKRLRLVAKGRPGIKLDRMGERWLRFLSEVLFQGKIIKERLFAGVMHALVFWGFLFFLVETIHHFSTGYGWHPLGEGGFHQIYGGIVAVFAGLVVIGITALAFRRFVLRPDALGKLSWSSGVVAVFIEILMITYLLSYFRLLHDPLTQQLNWWTHSATILAFLVLIPHSKHLHLVLSPLTTFLKDFELARIHPLDFEKEELGAEKLADFSAHTILGAFTCVECGRCYEHCPARQTGKLLDPKQLMLDLRAGFLADFEQVVVGPVIKEEILWQCTTCGACTYQCPVGIDQVVPILEMRRGQVSAAEFPATMRPLFDNLEKSGNPWKYPAEQAETFIAENGLPLFHGHDVLFWLGCMGRYDFYYQKVTLAMARILNTAGVRWGILKNEKCTGDAARRAGNELVFQTLAGHNIALLNAAAPPLILTSCPHCLRTLQEYRDLGLNPGIRMVHHSEYIAGLLRSGRLKPSGIAANEVVYHDACYLSRYIGASHVHYPREVIRGAGATIAEPLHRAEHSFCCGAGGALLFTEETVGERVNHHRVKELLETGSAEVSTACPFCHLMLRDGLRDLNQESVKVRDIAELLASGLPQPPGETVA